MAGAWQADALTRGGARRQMPATPAGEPDGHGEKPAPHGRVPGDGRGASLAPVHRFGRSRPSRRPGHHRRATASGCATPRATRSSTACRGSGACRSAMAARRSPRPSPGRRASWPITTPSSSRRTRRPPSSRRRWPSSAPAGMSRVFFTNSGSESNDTVFRLARVYWDCMGRPTKKAVHQPGQRLSRLDGRRGLARRHGRHACPVRPADRGHPPYRPALLVRRGPRDRHEPGRIRPRPRRASSRPSSSRSGPRTSPPSSASRSRARAASSSRPPATGPRSSASAGNTTSCWSPTR